MTIRSILFLGVILSVLFGAHFLVYFSFVKFFSMTSYTARVWLGAILAFLSVSFLISSILLHFLDSFLARAYYFLAGYWSGFLALLLIAILAVSIFRLAGVKNTYLTAAIFAIAFIYSLYGVWNAFNPNFKNIEVEIKNLPSEWRGKKIVQLSDVHLGNINRTGFLKKVVEKTNLANPDLIVITGDLFDGMGSGLGLDIFAEQLNRFDAKKGIYFITGNHENYLGAKKALEVLSKTSIQVIDDKVVDVGGLQIIGIGYPEFGKSKDVEKILEEQGYSKEKPSILLYHTPTNIGHASSSQTQTYWKPDTNFDFAKNQEIDLQLSGHSHSGQAIPYNFLTKLIYGGYDYGLFKEGDFNLYTTSGTGTWGPPMRTGTDSEIVVITLK